MIALTVAEQPSTITATAQYSTVTRLTVTQPNVNNTAGGSGDAPPVKN